MNLLTDNQVQLMETLLGCTQGKIKSVLAEYLRGKYDNVVETNDYVYAVGSIPIALAAHMDTVFETEIAARGVTNQVLYDRHKNMMHCVGFGGFDDKAGIFAIIQILQAGYRPHIIFSTDEERGCVGATALAKLACPFPDCRYIIQLDRRGINDCVFYEMDTTACADFVKYIESFGFEEAYGTFTDITEYCPMWGIAGVNLSIGYFHEHTSSEVLYVNPMLSTISKVKAMLSETEIPEFIYVEQDYYDWRKYYGWNRGDYSAYGGGAWENDDYDYTDYNPTAAKPALVHAAKNPKQTYTCAKCKKNNFLEAEMFSVTAPKYNRTKYYCGDCLPGNVNWCICCWEAFEIDKEKEVEDPNYVCAKCKKSGKESL